MKRKGRPSDELIDEELLSSVLIQKREKSIYNLNRKIEYLPYAGALPRSLAPETFDELPVVVSTKVNLPYLFYSMARRCCLLHLIKQNYFLKIRLDDSGISLPFFPSRSNLKLYNVSVFPKMTKRS